MFEQFFLQRGLTKSEAKVAALISEGLSNLEIAAIVYTSREAVKFHATSVFKKMNVKSRARLIVMAWKYRVDGLEETNRSLLPKGL